MLHQFPLETASGVGHFNAGDARPACSPAAGKLKTSSVTCGRMPSPLSKLYNCPTRLGQCPACRVGCFRRYGRAKSYFFELVVLSFRVTLHLCRKTCPWEGRRSRLWGFQACAEQRNYAQINHCIKSGVGSCALLLFCCKTSKPQRCHD